MGYRVGIDIGGTFTDFALLKARSHGTAQEPEHAGGSLDRRDEGLEKLAQIEGQGLSDFSDSATPSCMPPRLPTTP
jgi:N-methylhydantoinase A